MRRPDRMESGSWTRGDSSAGSGNASTRAAAAGEIPSGAPATAATSASRHPASRGRGDEPVADSHGIGRQRGVGDAESAEEASAHGPTTFELTGGVRLKGVQLGGPVSSRAAAAQPGWGRVEDVRGPQRRASPGRGSPTGHRAAGAGDARGADARAGRRAVVPDSDVSAAEWRRGRSGRRSSPVIRTSISCTSAYASGVSSTAPRPRSAEGMSTEPKGEPGRAR